MKKITIILFILGVTFSANAQNYKFGHINTGELVGLMSETDSARVKLDAYRTELVGEMDAMQTEYNTKVNTYQQKESTWTPAIKQTKEAEIQEIYQRLGQFQQSAQQDLSNMEQSLMAPIYQKARDAINKVAVNNQLTYVYDLSSGALIYINNDQSIDILPLAKKELGIPAEKVAPTQMASDNNAR